MKRKITALAISLTLAVSLSACGKDISASGNDADAKRIAELDISASDNDADAKRIAELEKELEELKAEQSKGTDNNKTVSVETETWDDEYVIPFADEKFKEKIIEITGISSRDITYGDVKNIEKLSNIESVSIENYKYFTGLKELSVKFSYSDNINALANCQSLTSLTILYSNALTDINALANCQNLTSLTIIDCDALTDISPLANCQNLTSLEIGGNRALTDISPLASCQSLTSLEINYCGVTDISPLANCQNLTSLNIIYCDNISDEAVRQVRNSLGLE